MVAWRPFVDLGSGKKYDTGGRIEGPYADTPARAAAVTRGTVVTWFEAGHRSYMSFFF